MTQQWDETPERDMTEKDYGDENQPQQKDPAGTQYDSGSGHGWTKILPSQPQQHCGHECLCPKYAMTNAYRYPCTHNTEPMATTVTEKCEHDTRIPKHHLITNTRTGKQYTTDLQQLCIDAGLSDRLTYRDIECLLADGETWYMLDECGNWAYLPSVYKVEDVRG
jgi:hypothetical protein